MIYPYCQRCGGVSQFRGYCNHCYDNYIKPIEDEKEGLSNKLKLKQITKRKLRYNK